MRHQLATSWAATFSYLYEPFDVYDFAFDRRSSTASSSPARWCSAMCIGHTLPTRLVFGLRYLW